MQKSVRCLIGIIFALFLLHPVAFTQEKPIQTPFGPVVRYNSPEVMPDGRIVFRIYAPKAESVGLEASDIPGLAHGGPQFAKLENGIWEATIGPIEPGAYRYTFLVNGVAVMDPRNPSVSESNDNAWSLVYVPGADFMSDRKVPHGAVASIYYYSTVLGKNRRMHIYTPPGYEIGNIKYPVFYLLHGAMDCDDSWSSVGRAGFILDNLIAAKKAKPMIVVMPAGHTSRGFNMAAGGRGMGPMVDQFTREFTQDILPYVEKNYRVLTARSDRAIAGLSMGGAQTLNIAVMNPDKFSYIGVFSSGIFGSAPKTAGAGAATAPPAPGVDWEQQNAAALDNAELKKGLKLLWFATGSDDFVLNTTKATLEIFKKHGFSPLFKESPGGHTWINWRNYLNVFAPRLFK